MSSFGIFDGLIASKCHLLGEKVVCLFCWVSGFRVQNFVGFRELNAFILDIFGLELISIFENFTALITTHMNVFIELLYLFEKFIAV